MIPQFHYPSLCKQLHQPHLGYRLVCHDLGCWHTPGKEDGRRSVFGATRWTSCWWSARKGSSFTLSTLAHFGSVFAAFSPCKFYHTSRTSQPRPFTSISYLFSPTCYSNYPWFPSFLSQITPLSSFWPYPGSNAFWRWVDCIFRLTWKELSDARWIGLSKRRHFEIFGSDRVFSKGTCCSLRGPWFRKPT